MQRRDCRGEAVLVVPRALTQLVQRKGLSWVRPARGCSALRRHAFAPV